MIFSAVKHQSYHIVYAVSRGQQQSYHIIYAGSRGRSVYLATLLNTARYGDPCRFSVRALRHHEWSKPILESRFPLWHLIFFSFWHSSLCTQTLGPSPSLQPPNGAVPLPLYSISTEQMVECSFSVLDSKDILKFGSLSLNFVLNARYIVDSQWYLHKIQSYTYVTLGCLIKCWI